LKNPDAEKGTDEGETPDPFESPWEAEGEFPEADPGELVADEEETSQGAEIVDAADLTEVLEGEVYDTLEEIEKEEEEDLDAIDETDEFDEEMEFFGPELVVDEGSMEAGETPDTDFIEASDECEGEPDGAVEPMEIQDDLLEAEEETTSEEDGTEAEPIDAEELSEGLEEIPDASEIEASFEPEEIPGEEVNGPELEEDSGEVEEEESAEEYDDVAVIDETGKQAPFDGESPAESPQEEPVESAPVQELSVGDEAGGTEKTDEENERVLSEKFNSSLSEMDRLYNQYLLITAGEYKVGSTDLKEKSNQARRVRLAEFYFGKFPVTNALFDVFV